MNRSGGLFWHERFALHLAFALAGATYAVGADPPKRAFDLPRGDAALTLKQFSQQSGEQILYPIDLVRGVQTNPVRGELTPRAALDRMVANTDLIAVEEARTGALSVRRKLRDPPPSRPP